MGQYYTGIILGDNKKTVKEHLSSYDYDNGAKLMEHSYIGNSFVGTFESRLINNPQRVCWGGDYAEPCKNRKTNLYERCKDKNKVTPTQVLVDEKEYPFIINKTKKQFVDKRQVKEIEGWGAKIHPLPLLTCEGNGLGGGDYRGEENFIGTWARDIIYVSNKVPNGFKEIVPNFKE